MLYLSDFVSIKIKPMLLDMLKGFAVGICASAPVGPIAILVIQKTMGKGRQAGFVTGLGASVVDTVYAIVALFALAFAQQLIAVKQGYRCGFCRGADPH
jgi:threonine/homoserine/homoserine lactone efflux protein